MKTDCEQALPLVSRVTIRLRSRNYHVPEYWFMDSGYKSEKIYKSIYFDFNAQAIIPLNQGNAKHLPAGFYDFDGTPCCSCSYKMVYGGKDNNYGYVVKTRINDNSRYISLLHRGSKNWQKIYNKRTSVESFCTDLKNILTLRIK